jgi:hypothetical protein
VTGLVGVIAPTYQDLERCACIILSQKTSAEKPAWNRLVFHNHGVCTHSARRRIPLISCHLTYNCEQYYVESVSKRAWVRPSCVFGKDAQRPKALSQEEVRAQPCLVPWPKWMLDTESTKIKIVL